MGLLPCFQMAEVLQIFQLLKLCPLSCKLSRDLFIRQPANLPNNEVGKKKFVRRTDAGDILAADSEMGYNGVTGLDVGVSLINI